MIETKEEPEEDDIQQKRLDAEKNGEDGGEAGGVGDGGKGGEDDDGGDDDGSDEDSSDGMKEAEMKRNSGDASGYPSGTGTWDPNANWRKNWERNFWF